MAPDLIFLPGTDARAHWMRQDVANILKRFFLCEQALVINQGAWIANIAPLELKLALGRMVWEDAMNAQALRQRVFELRFPGHQLDIGEDAVLIEIISKSINAPSAEAFVLALARVFKPALLQAYQQYVTFTDEIADGPTLRFLNTAIEEKSRQVQSLTRFAAKLLTTNPEKRSGAEMWVSRLNRALVAVGGLSTAPPTPSTGALEHLGELQPFAAPDMPARDERFHRSRFYWPDIIEPEFSYGEGIRLQLRSAVSNLNEVWAMETAGTVLREFADILGWDFIFDAARWTYDESRHCQMGLARLKSWNFEPAEMPLGTYIYDSSRGQPPVYRLGMLYYFESKNIGKKVDRAKTFAKYSDPLSQHDMEFAWADETIHAHFGQRWLNELHNLDPETYPSLEAIKNQCNTLVETLLATATEAERNEIGQLARSMIAKAERLAVASS